MFERLLSVRNRAGLQCRTGAWSVSSALSFIANRNARGANANTHAVAALYTRAQSLFRDLGMARADGSLRSLLARLARIDVG
jgi:hypothetical protein